MAGTLPILLAGSGPAGGSAASARLARSLGKDNVVFADLGGTTFDIGLVVDGQPLLASEAVVDGHSFFQPRVDITSIGAGSGSIARVEDIGQFKRLRVGPESAGARPGPACYGRGGVEPTVTDAAVVLGYLAPDDFRRSGPSVHRERAVDAVGALGTELGWSAVETAAAIVKIVEAESAELIRQLTVGRGIDPRRFHYFFYGGAGPLHAGAIARLLGVRTLSIPIDPPASVWSAGGAVGADVVRILNAPIFRRAPWTGDVFDGPIRELTSRAQEVIRSYATGGGADVDIQFQVSVGYVGQVHAIKLPLKVDIPLARGQIVDIEKVLATFFDWHDERYGSNFASRDRPVEIRELTCLAIVRRGSRWGDQEPRKYCLSSDGAGAVLTRPVWWPEAKEAIETPILELHVNESGSTAIAGPAIVRIAGSSVLVHPDQRLGIASDPVPLLTLETLDSSGRASNGPTETEA